MITTKPLYNKNVKHKDLQNLQDLIIQLLVQSCCENKDKEKGIKKFYFQELIQDMEGFNEKPSIINENSETYPHIKNVVHVLINNSLKHWEYERVNNCS